MFIWVSFFTFILRYSRRSVCKENGTFYSIWFTFTKGYRTRCMRIKTQQVLTIQFTLLIPWLEYEMYVNKCKVSRRRMDTMFFGHAFFVSSRHFRIEQRQYVQGPSTVEADSSEMLFPQHFRWRTIPFVRSDSTALVYEWRWNSAGTTIMIWLSSVHFTSRSLYSPLHLPFPFLEQFCRSVVF